jgi:hypothetical protein
MLMSAYLNIDTLFEPDWTEQFGRRAFPFEAFLSHNRYDTSGDVALELRHRGLSVWHDAHADMADREVRAKVHRAIRASRYIVVCVGRGFRDSFWIRAEYRPALTVERQFKLKRVVVLQMDDNPPVPEELVDAPLFTTADLDGLSAFLRDGNLLPAEPRDVIARARERLDGILALPEPGVPATGSAEEDGSMEEDKEGAALRKILRTDVADLEQEASGVEFSNWFFAVRCLAWDSPQSLPSPSSREAGVLRRLAVRVSSSANSDNRANGAMLLSALDRQWRTPETLCDLFAYLCLEVEATVIGTAVEDLLTNLQRVPAAADPDALSVIALRAPQTFSYGKFEDLVALLPEAVRCRVGVREGLGELLPSENLSLIEERLGFELARLADCDTLFTDKLDAAGPLLAISEFELLARQTCDEILRFHAMDQAFKEEVLADESLLEGALRVIEQITTASSEGHRRALHAMADWALDFLLTPLTLYRPLRDLWPRAKRAAERLCDELSSSDKVAPEIPAYRALVAEIDAGGHNADAQHRLRLRLMSENAARRRLSSS